MMFVIICILLCVWVFWGNSLSFGLTLLDFVSGASDEHGKAKARSCTSSNFYDLDFWDTLMFKNILKTVCNN